MRSISILLIAHVMNIFGQPMINVDSREVKSLNGQWQIIIDPYETGYYDYRYEPNENGYFKNSEQNERWELIEYSFDTDEILMVPGDWNSQKEKLLLYEGTVWYKKSFDYFLPSKKRLFLYFGAVNYDAKVYLNGEFLGQHIGGFTPFQFEITNKVKEKDNFIIIKADNKRLKEAVPTVNTDWFNYGGITRKVLLIETEETYIKDYFIQLEKNNSKRIFGWIQIDGTNSQQNVNITIPEAEIDFDLLTDQNGFCQFSEEADLILWSPQNPKLYDVNIKIENSEVNDRIGFRTIETKNQDILLNGNSIYLKGVCIHEEAPYNGGGRAFSEDHSRVLLGWAKDLGCNFVRLAHYTHNESMMKVADEMGIMVWAEIPVYWTIQWENQETYQNAENQLVEMVTRDKNRASIIMWSVANETPLSDARFKFLSDLAKRTRELDNTRLITAALEKHYINDTTLMINDPFGEVLDVIGCNSYIGWYDGLPDKGRNMNWETVYNKPVIISEFGGGALQGFHGDKLTRWSEEFQEDVYIENINMFKKVDFIRGMAPWLLKDFKSPKRPLPKIQDFWNRKGLISDLGEKKKAYYILEEYYKSIKD